MEVMERKEEKLQYKNLGDLVADAQWAVGGGVTPRVFG